MLSVAGMLPRRQRRAIARASVSALLAALPLLYVSLRRPPPAALAGDTAFWFLTSNCVVAAIVATADDAGALFSGPSSSKDDGGGAGAGAEGGGVAVPVVVPLAVGAAAGEDDEPGSGVVVSVEGGGGRVREEVARTVVDTGCNDSVEDLLLNHTPRIQQGEEDEVATIGEPSADMHAAAAAATMMVNGQGGGEGEKDSPATLAFDETAAAVPVGKLGSITKVDEEALLSAEPEPEPEAWASKLLVTSKSVPEEEAADDEDWPPDGVLAQDNNKGGVAAARDGRLRRTATEGSKQAVEDTDSSDYWELSDEELNRRVENFIARFNREMRLQIEQELVACHVEI